MGSKKLPQAYVLENLEYLAKSLVHIRGLNQKGENEAINLEGLQKAIMALPRKDRENVERFWGLTGGTNHSKKLLNVNSKDIAFIRQGDQAIKSLRKLFRIDYLSMYDVKFKSMMDQLNKKFSKKKTNISDLEAIKYLLAMLVFLENGPKMPFEEGAMYVDNHTSEYFTFDEYSMILSAYQEAYVRTNNKEEEKRNSIPDGAVNLRMIQDWLDMLDLKDVLTIKKSLCIEIPKAEIPKGYVDSEIEPIYTFGEIRKFKEKIFSYGPWEVTSQIILGNKDVIDKLEGFMEGLEIIRNDWTKLTEFKTGQMQLRTAHELRTLDVYTLGGLEFTDIYEVMFIYLERNIIAPEN